MTLKHLPPTFCWTKIGTESGEELPTVVLRKEWERRLGGGRFLWGINQPLGSSAQVAAHRTGSLLALFSPVASRVRPGERKRADALLWNAWIDASGQVRPLPPHTFIASRARLPSGRRREQHYALVCASSTALTVGTQLRVFPEHLRSVSTGKPLGVAQGAAVVDCVGRAKEQTGRSYPLALSVELEAPYFVRLAQPCVLKARDLADVNNATRAGDFDRFVELVARLRGRSPTDTVRGVTRDLFDVAPIETAAAYVAPAHVARLRQRPAAEHPRELTGDLFDLGPAEAAAFGGVAQPRIGRA
ncbi:hypothetical protein [Burkholderia vietnamiensis]|jgi:hypothetical protein|uniref:hypothetical protein n=1 Tax=Burkholderia vietnamiensis TaxID=60552 RepID=UPI00075463F8|nr:hypothetical protein [Burkholderia vietnamiensis]TPQ48246.1 hypothetical protein C2U71_01265 [Burkholderia ubonensis]AOJ16416.1 hypothetical protein WJ02_23050 [Burkholderia vietnamiensis]KVE32921.1 hypothetical protein WI93_25620 [Burkholderia vietnamiensis]KVE55013.1 hypothetical protein WI94_13890 [Burkholderia vietnamiensis]KVE67616.1 hypothetical protein WI97_09530 [Burkholderia vietnamiensis]